MDDRDSASDSEGSTLVDSDPGTLIFNLHQTLEEINVVEDDVAGQEHLFNHIGVGIYMWSKVWISPQQLYEHERVMLQIGQFHSKHRVASVRRVLRRQYANVGLKVWLIRRRQPPPDLDPHIS